MRCLILLIMLALTGQPLWGQEWLSDAQAAQDRAGQENKFVLLNFTGPDWCRWCAKLKSEVFDTPEFGEFAQAKLILMEVDFPRNKGMAHLHKQANNRLAAKYHVRSFPTLIVLNQTGDQVGRLSYVEGGPKAFLAKLEQETQISRALAPPPPEPEPPPLKPFTWTPPPAPTPIQYGPLTLKGISGTKDRRMVLINNASMMAGETAKVRAQNKEVVVVCKKIGETSVLITCDGKEMELKLAKRE
jgi:thioredoxin-related protein